MLGSATFIQDLWYAVLFKIILLLIIPGIVYFFVWNYHFKDLLLGLKPTITNITLTILFVLAGFFLNAGHIKSLSVTIPLFSDAPIRIFMGVMMPLFIAAIPEELFFRGYLQTRLEKKWNRLFSNPGFQYFICSLALAEPVLTFYRSRRTVRRTGGRLCCIPDFPFLLLVCYFPCTGAVPEI